MDDTLTADRPRDFCRAASGDWLAHRAWRNYWLGFASGLTVAVVAVAVGLYLAVA